MNIFNWQGLTITYFGILYLFFVHGRV